MGKKNQGSGSSSPPWPKGKNPSGGKVRATTGRPEGRRFLCSEPPSVLRRVCYWQRVEKGKEREGMAAAMVRVAVAGGCAGERGLL
jgi:hypothetical protein